jgi:hypothetical protein
MTGAFITGFASIENGGALAPLFCVNGAADRLLLHIADPRD